MPKGAFNTKSAEAKADSKPHGFDAELAAFDAAGQLEPAEALPQLRAGLGHRNNLIVSRVAKYSARLGLKELAPELALAFTRFMPQAGDPVKTDPQCWAKNEIAKALAGFEYQEADLFLAGMHHHQYEPTWGGSSDTAGPLRGTCALALVQCREISSSALLRHLVTLFRDNELPVRVNAARAVEQVGSDAAALLLRLRAELGSGEPELLGACVGGVLRIDGGAALDWVAGFLAQGDDLAAEAAFVLAEQRSDEAVDYLRKAHASSYDREFRKTLLHAVASTRLPSATRWLLDAIASGKVEGGSAAKAICEAAPGEDTLEELRRLGHPCRGE